MNAEIPRVTVIGAITPSAKSARAEKLEYPNLERVVQRHAPYENARINEFWDAEDDSLAELNGARQLATQYMLRSSLALSKSSEHALWSRRYTQAAGEIYGLPEPEMAKRLWEQQQSDIAYELEVPFAETAARVGDFLQEQYGPVFDALDMFPEGESITPEGIVDAFNAAIHELAVNDSRWVGWSARLNDKIDSIRIDTDEKIIDVGALRANVDAQQLKALFAHEALVHVLRHINGAMISKELGEGLPDHQDAEEGFGVFVEYALTGKISDKVIDRYVDIAYALGQIDGKEHTRKELLEHAMIRALKRNKDADNKKSVEELTKEVYAHINRIYRGSLGNEHVGVITKDISYFKGFMDVGNYIHAQLESGMNLAEVMAFLTTGKFDPLNQKHADYVVTAISSREASLA